VTSIAIVYDKFLVQGGGERVCEILLEAFPEATLYALNAKPRSFWEARLGRKVRSPLFGSLFASRFLVTILYPLAALLMATLRVRADVVLAYSSTCGKFVRFDGSSSILYSNYPNRGLYQPEKLISSTVARTMLAPIMAVMRRIERRQIAKYDRVISISETSRRAMLDFASVDSEVLMPPFNEEALEISGVRSLREADYFTLVSRLEPEKGVEYVVEAFRHSCHRLKVIGKGSLLAQLSRHVGENVEFLGYVDDAELARHLAGSKALIFPSDIEYSLVPLEATFLGTPVVSLDCPSMREILIDITSGRSDANAVFYRSASPTDLLRALEAFEAVSWSKAAIKQSAARFGRGAFISEIRAIVEGAPVANGTMHPGTRAP
jgi:glycosyltransferase involved in cell wall biosynthesis